MDPIPQSPYNYANKIALIAIKSLEEVMGKNGLNAILNLAHLPQMIDHYPPDNLDRQFNFADFSAINLALEEMYGPRGGRGLALRAGRAAFADSLRNFGALAGAGDLAFKVCPFRRKCVSASRRWHASSAKSATSTQPSKSGKRISCTRSIAARFAGGATIRISRYAL